MFNYLKNTVFALILCFSLNACFDVKEELTLKSNGSGSYSFTMDLSQLKQIIQMSQSFAQGMSRLDSSNIVKQPAIPNPMEKMRLKFDLLESELESIDGITDYEVVYDTVNYIIGAKYKFRNVDALNASINALQKKENGEQGEPLQHFKYTGGTFERFNTISKEDVKGELAKNDSLATAMLGKMNYQIIYHFDKKVKDFDNENYFMSKDGKTLTFSASLLEIMQGNIAVENKVKLK